MKIFKWTGRWGGIFHGSFRRASPLPFNYSLLLFRMSETVEALGRHIRGSLLRVSALGCNWSFLAMPYTKSRVGWMLFEKRQRGPLRRRPQTTEIFCVRMDRPVSGRAVFSILFCSEKNILYLWVLLAKFLENVNNVNKPTETSRIPI